jgi:hypothetical protein
LQTIGYAILVAVMMPREKWTDERLDDLNRKVDDGFTCLDGGIRELRVDVKDLRCEMNVRFDTLNRNLIGVAAAIIAALIGVNAF